VGPLRSGTLTFTLINVERDPVFKETQVAMEPVSAQVLKWRFVVYPRREADERCGERARPSLSVRSI
jgi:hypothetical protein